MAWQWPCLRDKGDLPASHLSSEDGAAQSISNNMREIHVSPGRPSQSPPHWGPRPQQCVLAQVCRPQVEGPALAGPRSL